MTDPDLTAAYVEALEELESVIDALDKFGPVLVRRHLSDCAPNGRVRTRSGTRPPELSACAARLVREIADDAIERTLERRAA